MKFLFIVIILIIFQGCSFDNKTGIWTNEQRSTGKSYDVFKEFKKISASNKLFNKIITLDKDLILDLPSPIKNFEWKDVYYKQSNNFQNFKYNDRNQLIFNSKKLTKYEVNDLILFENNNLIICDQKGNIIVFSVNENKIISKFNFYKKKFKKIPKLLNFIIQDDIIYISDNIGYLYAYNYKINKIIWAKDYKIPFRSNLKLSKNKLIASNQNNNLYFFDKNTGAILKLIPTEETTIKNKFVNNLSIGADSLFFLNSYGSLYSLDIDSMRINWFLNLNKSLNLNPGNLFFGNQIVYSNNKIVVSSNTNTYILDANNGSIISEQNLSSIIKPFILDNYVFLITSNHLLVSMNLNNGQIIYSNDINEQVAKFLKIKKKKVDFKNLSFANNDIFIFLSNSFILKFANNGLLKDVVRLPSKINTQPIFVDNSILFLNNKNKLSIVD
jgi:outer membrane protein assembly factor BamB